MKNKKCLCVLTASEVERLPCLRVIWVLFLQIACFYLFSFFKLKSLFKAICRKLRLYCHMLCCLFFSLALSFAFVYYKKEEGSDGGHQALWASLYTCLCNMEARDAWTSGSHQGSLASSAHILRWGLATSTDIFVCCCKGGCCWDLATGDPAHSPIIHSTASTNKVTWSRKSVVLRLRNLDLEADGCSYVPIKFYVKKTGSRG